MNTTREDLLLHRAKVRLKNYRSQCFWQCAENAAVEIGAWLCLIGLACFVVWVIKQL